jgi:formylglycine-generating enzyme required for sulfatase activity
LREKLGDSDHRLIKTVPRRGYLLEALPPASESRFEGIKTVADPAGGGAGRTNSLRPAVLVGVIGILLCAAAIAATLFWAQLLPGSNGVADAVSAPGMKSFKDCADCPEMIALPAGQFMMGSPADERGRLRAEGLPRKVLIKGPFALGRFEVTVGQFEAFVKETGFAVGNLCRLIEKIDGETVGFSEPRGSFRQMSYQVTDTQPVGCVNLHDAQAYVTWLRRRTGKPYRLPTESEWEYAARAGTETAFSFGDDEQQVCEHARFADLDTPFGWRNICRSGITTYGPLPVGSLRPNPWGLFDMHGNIWEWVEDCWTSDPSQIPTDGSALVKSGICEVGVLRGGSWASGAPRVRSAYRLPQGAARHNENSGFRVALSLGE